MNILIVDDDSVDRAAIKRHLRRPGREINFLEAATAQEGLDALAKQEFDCIFFEYRLPDMDGIAFLRKIYSAETDMTTIPAVMLTGNGSKEVMADALRWGAQDYLIKDVISTDTLNISLAKACEIFELKKSRRQAEDHLRQNNKMEAIGQLTSGVAHDFNNLLTVILGNTRILQRKIDDPTQELSREDLSRKVKTIETAARKGATLVRSLMIFTRQRPLRVEIADLNECVLRTCSLLQRSLGTLIEVKSVLDPDTWPVQVDMDQFENALINIAVNARDAMPGGGKLTIETQNVVIDDEYTQRHPDATTGPHAVVIISDTGSGMPDSVARRIFEPFFTTKEAGEGTGLGLSIVYGFIRQSGGHIQVYSEQGLGTAFRIYLPQAPKPDVTEMPDETDAYRSKADETILVVDDDAEVRNVVVGMLQQLGYKVLAAQDGHSAMEMLKGQTSGIHLFFVDLIMMAGITGMELAKQAQAHAPGLKVLFTSGYTENAIPDYQLLPGQELIGKPYLRDALAKKVRFILDRKDIQK
jgi:signal transduction histidine kinase